MRTEQEKVRFAVDKVTERRGHKASRLVGSFSVSALAIVGLVLSSGCGPPTATRDFTRVVNADGRPVLSIKCEYVGKRPGDLDKYINSHNYKRIDTDFYRLTIRNLTDQPAKITRVTYRMETGPMKGERSASADSIAKTWGTNIVPASSSIERANNMVWSKSSRNALIKKYFFEVRGVDGSTQSVSSEIRLAYQR